MSRLLSQLWNALCAPFIAETPDPYVSEYDAAEARYFSPPAAA